MCKDIYFLSTSWTLIFFSPVGLKLPELFLDYSYLIETIIVKYALFLIFKLKS